MLKEPIQKKSGNIRKLISQNDFKGIASDLTKMHHEDIASLINSLEVDEKRRVFRSLCVEAASSVILDVDENSKRQLLQQINIKKLVSIVENMASDDAADVIGSLPEDLKNSVLDNIPVDEARDVRMLLKYPEDTAGGIMQSELVSTNERMTVKEAIEAIRILSDDAGDIHNVFVVDDHKRLSGILSLRKLILAKPDATVSQLMEEIPVKINVSLDQEEVANYFKKYDVVSLPVIDEQERLVGRILVDDIVDVLEEEASEDILKMAGTDEEEFLFTTSIFKVVRLRLPWIIVSLIGGIITGMLLWQFKTTLQTILALAVFIPVITGMGGNVGTQSSSITVRGLATGRINISYVGKHIKREALVGTAMGLTCGIITGIVAKLWGETPYLGLIVGISMFFAISAAALMGTLLPLFFKRCGIDPALASGPFVTTSNDIIGLLIYFILATLMLMYIG